MADRAAGSYVMRKPTPIKDIDDPRWMRAVSHPLRVRILGLLEEEPASPKMIAAELGQTLGATAYHVRTLLSLGLLELVETRQRRGAMEHYYRAREHPRFTDDAWEGLDVVAKQRMLGSLLNEAHDYAMRAAASGGFDRADANFTRTPLQLDAAGWTQLAEASKRWLAEASEIEQRSQDRLGGEDGESVDVGMVMLLFQAAPARLAATGEKPAPARDAKRRASSPRR